MLQTKATTARARLSPGLKPLWPLAEVTFAAGFGQREMIFLQFGACRVACNHSPAQPNSAERPREASLWSGWPCWATFHRLTRRWFVSPESKRRPFPPASANQACLVVPGHA